MQHDYTDAEIIGAWNNRKLPQNTTLATNLRAFLAALPARLPPIPKSLPPRPPRPEPKANQQEAIDAAFLDSRHISLWAVADSPYWDKEAPDRLALAQAYEQARPQSAELVELRAELDYARKTIEEKSAEIEALKAQPGPWPGQQEAIDAAFEKQNIQYLDGSSLCDDWNHEAPARLAIAQAYDAARPQSVVINEVPHGEKQPDLSGGSEKQDPYAELKAAHAAGKEIEFECKFKGSGDWQMIPKPIWDGVPARYRIKPEAKPVAVNEVPQGEKQPDKSGESEEPAWIPHDGGPCPLKDEEVAEWQIEWNDGNFDTYKNLKPSEAGVWKNGITSYRVLKWKPGFGPEAKAEAQPTTSPGWTPAVGDTVRLKSGGPVMTVHHISKDGSIACTHNANGAFEFATLPAACLTPDQP